MWVRYKRIEDVSNLWLHDRLPYMVWVSLELRRHAARVENAPELQLRYDWCYENIGTACLRYFPDEPIRYDVYVKNPTGMWVYLHGKFRFRREVDACAFKLRWY